MRRSVDHASLDDRHVRFERRFPPRTFEGGDDPPPWHAGDSYVPDLAGWVLSVVLSYEITDPPTPSTARVRGTLQLRTAWKAAADYVVAGFALGAGGRLYIPWPAIELRLADENGGNTLDTTAVITFTPVFRDEPRPAGITTLLYGRTKGTLPKAGSLTIPVPPGATEYRVMPVGETGNPLSVLEQASGIEYAQYRIDAVTASALPPGTETGAGAWRETPPQPEAQITVDGVEDDAFTVFFRYDLGAMR
jgi:hypothetical protein